MDDLVFNVTDGQCVSYQFGDEDKSQAWFNIYTDTEEKERTDGSK